MEKTLLIVDVSNVFFTVRRKLGDKEKLDYKKLLNLCGKVDRAICYSSDMNGKATNFFNYLLSLGFEIKLKKVKHYFNNGVFCEKANCDIDMAIDMVTLCEEFSHIILVSSDGDMIPAIQYCQNKGVTMHVIGCGINSDLRKIVTWDEIDQTMLESTHVLAASA